MRFLLPLLALILPLAASPGWGQTWPTRPVRIISSSPPAGASDTLARSLAQALQEQTGQPFIVENRAGAAGIVGSDYVAKAEPDGYTWLVTNVGPQTIVPHLVKDMPYDARQGLRHATIIGTLPLVLMVGRQVPATSLAEYVALAKAKPGSLNFGTGGNGTLHHLTGEMLKRVAGIDIVHVPYRGAQAATQDLLGGRIESMFDSLPSAAPHLRAGTVRAIAVSGAARSPAFPDVPTIAEQGYPGLVTTNWFGLAGPARLPDAVVARLHEEVVKALANATVKARFASIGVEPSGMPPAETQAYVLGEIDRWQQVVRETGATLD
jgi:tripartite-type tricarboxylate transporter receptor subunit TctC